MKYLSVILLLLVCRAGLAAQQIAVEALFGNKAMLMIDGVRHTLTVGQSTPDGVRLVDVNPHRAILEVDGKQQSYQPGSAVSLSFSQREQVEETVYADRMGMFKTFGSINGQPVHFLVDTGATLIAMNKSQAKKLGIQYRLQGKPAGVSTASGYERGYRVKLKSVTLGKIKRSNVDAMVIDGNHPGPILLGMSFLDKLKVEKSGDALTIRQQIGSR